ncbi:hypothetical protein EDC01DRAFT_627806 [Geopyxis carbonaria]|nr:hypothetical protein EDC01DRAFT_627806 [Geopyxis carbonaria]
MAVWEERIVSLLLVVEEVVVVMLQPQTRGSSSGRQHSSIRKPQSGVLLSQLTSAHCPLHSALSHSGALRSQQPVTPDHTRRKLPIALPPSTPPVRWLARSQNSRCIASSSCCTTGSQFLSSSRASERCLHTTVLAKQEQGRSYPCAAQCTDHDRCRRALSSCTPDRQ